MTTELPLKTKLEAAFEEFHQSNPKIWDLFCKFCLEAANAGRKRLGAKAVMERLRWETFIAKDSKEEVKINNSYTAYYARKFVMAYPEYDELFTMRKIKTWSGE